MMGTRVSYLDEQQDLAGYLAAPDSGRDLPAVLISECQRVDMQAGGSIGGAGLCGFRWRSVRSWSSPESTPVTDDSCRAVSRRSLAISP